MTRVRSLSVARHWDVVLLIALAAVVFRPWDAPHLPLTDFGLFLSARGTSHSLFSQYAGIASYYFGEGRFCLITYLYMVLGSAAFGTWAPGWHWTFFALNVTVLLLARSLFSRMGLNQVASFIALALWATMGPTAELWIRIAGEPVALIFFLVALHLALNYADAEDWRRRAMIIAALSLGIILTKELLVVLLPAGWLMSRVRLRDGEWSWAQWTRRDTFLISIVSAVVTTAMIPVIYVATHASAASYAAQYASRPPIWGSFLERLEVALIPSGPRLHWLVGLRSDPAWAVIRTLPNLAWIAMVLFAVLGETRRRILWPVVIGLSWVLAGVLAYLPWPSQGMFYMMPFALGTMFLAAHALNKPLSGKKHRRAVLGTAALLIIVSSIEARSTLYQHRLRATLNGEVIDAIAKQGGAETLIGAVPDPLPGTGGWSNHIRGFGSVATGMRVNHWRDMSCADAKTALEVTPGAVVVSSAGGCGQIGDSSIVISGSVPRSRWPMIWKTGKSEGRMFIARSAARGGPS
ncbi:MAG: hypothetical protein ABI556_13340 [Gemmatimonadales bacterium]